MIRAICAALVLLLGGCGNLHVGINPYARPVYHASSYWQPSAASYTLWHAPASSPPSVYPVYRPDYAPHLYQPGMVLCAGQIAAPATPGSCP